MLVRHIECVVMPQHWVFPSRVNNEMAQGAKTMTPQAAAAMPARSAEKPVFEWQDPLLLDAELSEEGRMLRDSARDFCQEKLMPPGLATNPHDRLHRASL